MILTDRDYIILKEIDKWRFLLSRHIKNLCGFEGGRATDRRLKLLVDNNFLKREKIIYGVPYIYTVTHKGKMLIGTNKRQDKIRLDQLQHDIYSVDIACIFINKYNISANDILSEKQLNSINGFSVRKHVADFSFTKDKENYAVEIELSNKSKTRLSQIIKDNYMMYDHQIYVIPRNNIKLVKYLEIAESNYDNFEFYILEDILQWNSI